MLIAKKKFQNHNNKVDLNLKNVTSPPTREDVTMALVLSCEREIKPHEHNNKCIGNKSLHRCIMQSTAEAKTFHSTH